MARQSTRRAVLAALLGGGVAAGLGTDAGGYLDRFAPFSGSVWDTLDEELPASVDSPYGTATLRYDDAGVPHIEAENEAALYFAVGYAQGADRLFQMDLQRRQLRGQLSAVVGEATLSSDRFHRQLDFAGAAAATWAAAEGTETGDLLEAYCEGVNRHLDGSLPPEFDLLEFEPAPWTPEDVLLGEKQISWGLTGSFRTLRRETLAAAAGEDITETLLPHRLDHDAAILNHEPGETDLAASGDSTTQLSEPDRPAQATHPDLEGWLAGFERGPGIGSNSWVVSGEHTDSGAPIMANDPHLTLMAPPVWYEMNLETPEYSVRGVTFPGVPMVIIGENHAGAWGFTNAGADVIDFYDYETRDGEYRYEGEWREFETRTETIEVAGADDREVQFRKTVHGPMLSAAADGDELRTEVGVAWTGFTATRTLQAVRDIARSDGLEAFEAALRRFDLPTQNCVYADREGNTLYRVTGKVPIRRTDGEPVAGTRVFDGSAGEGEWEGYTPYDDSSWEAGGFIPFEEMPTERNPAYLGTANQRVVDDADYPHYFAEAYSDPFRGIRLWNRLDERIASDDPVTPEWMRDLQRDAVDLRAALFVPALLEARETVEDELGAAGGEALDALGDWSFEMRPDSRAALVFERFLTHYRDTVVHDRLADLLPDDRDPSSYDGGDWVLLGLSPDSEWFPDGRDAAIATALDATLSELDDEGWETYGDYNVTTIDHPFDQEWLNYPRYPTAGSAATLNNFRKESSAGSSWRQVCPMDGDSQAILPGGNDGAPFSEHYDDQLRRWADGQFKPMSLAQAGELAVEFGGGAE